MSQSVSALRERAAGRPRRIVFARCGADAALEAAVRLTREGLARPIVVGNVPDLRARLRAGHVAPEIVAPGPVGDYRAQWLAHWAVRGVSASEADESLKDPVCFGEAMLLGGAADALLVGEDPPRPSVGGRWEPSHGVAGTDFVLVLFGADAWCLFAEPRTSAAGPGAGCLPTAAALAQTAVVATTLARRITGRSPELRFVTPTIPVTLSTGPRYRSAEEDTARRVEEAIATFRARAANVPVARTRLASWESPQPGSVTCAVLTHGAQDLRALAGRLANAGWSAGPLSIDTRGGVRCRARWVNAAEAIVDLAVVAALSAE